MRVLHIEGRPLGIHTNCLAPNGVTPRSVEAVQSSAVALSKLPDWYRERLTARAVAPMAAWLVHEDCPLSGEILTTGGGHVARFFVGRTRGYFNAELTIEDLRQHHDEVMVTDGYEILGSGQEESSIFRRLLRPDDVGPDDLG